MRLFLVLFIVVVYTVGRSAVAVASAARYSRFARLHARLPYVNALCMLPSSETSPKIKTAFCADDGIEQVNMVGAVSYADEIRQRISRRRVQGAITSEAYQAHEVYQYYCDTSRVP